MKEIKIRQVEKEFTEYETIQEMIEGESFIGVMWEDVSRYILATDENETRFVVVNAYGILESSNLQNNEKIRFFSFTYANDLYEWLLVK